MTLREMCDVVGIDEDPMGCAFAIAAVIRTGLQGEPSTFEGECATLVKATETYGPVDDPATIRYWLERLGPIPDMDVPDSLLMSIIEADRGDGEEHES